MINIVINLIINLLKTKNSTCNIYQEESQTLPQNQKNKRLKHHHQQ